MALVVFPVKIDKTSFSEQKLFKAHLLPSSGYAALPKFSKVVIAGLPHFILAVN